MAYIYQITNDINGKIYIGKTERSIQDRWEEHCRDYLKEHCEKRPLYSAMRKYGIEHFSIELIEETDSPEDREIYWIEQKQSFKYGYNATKGGDGRKYIDYDLVISTYNNLKSINQTAKNLNISPDSVSNILHEKKIFIPAGKDVVKAMYSKKVSMYSLSDEYLKTFSSLSEASQYMIDNSLTGCKLSTIRTHISEVCREKRKTASGFKWRFD